MNAVDEHGILVPPARRIGGPRRGHRAGPLAVTKYGVSKYGASPGIGKEGSGARSTPMVMGKGRVGRYGNEEEAAYAYNDAIREAGLEGVRKVNPVVDGKLALKPPLRDRRPPSSRSTGA